MSSSPIGPQLEHASLSNPATYVVDNDVRQVRDLVDRNARELKRWRLSDELSPTACAMLAFLTLFRGMRSGPEGCGVQLAVETWCRVLGRSRRMVQYAFDELVARRFISRRRRFVTVEPWTDARGRTHTQADVHYAVYLTDFGARRLERRREVRKVHLRRGVVVVVAGVVGNLLATLRPEMRLIASRVADAVRRCTPTTEANQEEREPPSSSPSRTCGKAGAGPPDRVWSPLRGQDLRPKVHDEHGVKIPSAAALGSLGRRGHRAAADAWNAEVDALWRRRAFTPATAWPELWNVGDELERKRLSTEFERYRWTLAERFKLESQVGPVQRALELRPRGAA